MKIQLAIAARYVDPPAEVSEFLDWMEGYQSNHYGNFDTEKFRNVYLALPADMRDALTYRSRGRLYRGDEFYRDDLYAEYRKGRKYAALSFTPNHGVAEHFGHAKPLSAVVETHDASIDTRNLVRYLNQHKYEHNIGDDESEVILIGVTLK
jgi:hypothetical protein